MKFLKFSLVVLAFSTTSDAFWRMSCGIIQTGRVDPIINFNTASSHIHKIAGASNININSTQASISASNCTSCTIQADKSAYWTPQLYYAHASGSFEEVPNSGMAVYYLDRGDEGGWKPFPNGLRMLSGNNSARSYDGATLTVATGGRPIADRVSFACIDFNNRMPETSGLSNLTCPQGLRAQIHMQSCWNGVDLYKPDQSHVAYLSRIDNGICPPGYPILFPHLFYEVLYSVNGIDTSDGGKFTFSNGDTTGYSFHGDFMNGWDNSVLSDAISKCLVDNVSGVVESCSSFSASNNDDIANACTERSPVYPCEKVHGILASLPGCSTTRGITTCPGGIQPSCSANYATIGLVISPGNNQYTSIGCYTEATNGRALSEKTYSDPIGMTVDKCLSFCSGYKFSGVEYGQECYCANSMSIGTNIAISSECSMPCTGNESPTWGQLCGGRSRLNIYQRKVLMAPHQTIVTTSTNSQKAMQTTLSTTLSLSSTTKPIASQTAIPPIHGYNYKGCYTEAASGRALDLDSETSNTMTLELCASYCSSLNYPLFGVEYSKECYCGTYPHPGSTPAPQSDCKMPCSGSSSEFCGGGSRLSIYALAGYITPSIPSRFAGYTYIGCYTDSLTRRALSGATKVDYKLMTLDVCAAFCKGWAYWGVEYGGECRCGNSLDPGSVLAPGGDKECSSTCPGNYTQLACGASLRFSLYKNSP